MAKKPKKRKDSREKISCADQTKSNEEKALKRALILSLLVHSLFYRSLSLRFYLCLPRCICLRSPRACSAPTNGVSRGPVMSLCSAVEGPEVVGNRIVHHHVSEAVRAPRGPAASWNQRQRSGRPLAGLVGAGRGAPWCPGDQGEGRTQGTHRNPSRISHHQLVRKTCATELPDWCSDIEFDQVSRINSGVHIRAKRLIIIVIFELHNSTILLSPLLLLSIGSIACGFDSGIRDRTIFDFQCRSITVMVPIGL